METVAVNETFSRIVAAVVAAAGGRVTVARELVELLPRDYELSVAPTAESWELEVRFFPEVDGSIDPERYPVDLEPHVQELLIRIFRKLIEMSGALAYLKALLKEFGGGYAIPAAELEAAEGEIVLTHEPTTDRIWAWLLDRRRHQPRALA